MGDSRPESFESIVSDSEFADLRSRMVEEQLRARGVADERVLDAMARVPRHVFPTEQHREQAYEDHPLPIGDGQTISQPYIVALMLEALSLKPEDKVLEVGTGSGYATALLAELAAQVVSIERHAALADEARELLARLGYTNLKMMVGDGSRGFFADAPYDAILVSAASASVPPELLAQMAEGGRMVIPVGSPEAQQLQLIHIRNGQPHTTLRELCRFVPLVSDAAS
jgi:protein-L-isoaspartate(D-aspartate) O-methyltransferase